MILTIGIYGFTEKTFARALRDHEPTALVDIRRRRGVRGADYRFGNATALQKILGELGIPYLAETRLAPTRGMLELQRSAAGKSGVQKRRRGELSPAFVDAYRNMIHETFPPAAIDALLLRSGPRPVLLCVETAPAACHRSLAAEWMNDHVAAGTLHIVPEPA